jgi:hypothetical protein
VNHARDRRRTSHVGRLTVARPVDAFEYTHLKDVMVTDPTTCSQGEGAESLA